MRELLPLLPLLIVPVVIALTVWAQAVQRRRTAANLQKLAGRLGLEFQTASGWMGRGSVTGKWRGRDVRFFNYTTGSGKSQVTWSAMTAEANLAAGFTFSLKKQGLGTKLAGLFGAHEIAVGDAEFDRAWFLQTSRPELLRAILLPELRTKLAAVRQAGGTGAFELKDGVVKYAETGTLADAKRADRFAALADTVCELAEVAEVAAEEPGGT